MKLPFCLRRCCSRITTLVVLTSMVVLAVPPAAVAQEPGNVVVQAPLEASGNAPLLIAAEVLFGEPIERVYLLYRTLGMSQYTRMEMDLRGSRATTLIPAADARPPFIEYYLVLQTRTGELQTHPLSSTANPFSEPPANPLRTPIRPAGELDMQALLLSPDPGVTPPADELVISISLLRADSIVNRRSTRLLVDGADVTAEALFADDILVYVPGNFSRELAPGRHQITVQLFDDQGSLYRSVSFPFAVRGLEPVEGAPEAEAFRSRLSLQFESRHEQISGSGTWYNRGGLQANGSFGIWSFRSNVFLTSDEQPDRQPQNRFFVGVSIPSLSAGYGDSYPAFSNLILNGRRVRGLHSSVALGGFTVDLALGQTERPLEGQLLKVIPVDSLGLEQAADPNAGYGPLSPTTWGKFRYGTYTRTLFALRPSVGSGRNWRIGFTWLKAKDDVGSISYGNRPQEDLVVGSDVVFRPFGEALEIFGEGAFSAFNTDISSGNFTDAHIDSTFDDPAAVKQARDLLDNFITVNDNLHPLSLKTLSTVAYEFGLGLNLLSQNLRLIYLFRGDQYTSFGQSFIRKDLRGFSAVDRIRLIDNQVFLSVGYERLRDNTGNTKPATTTFTTLDAAVSYYPLTSLPSLTVGFGHISNSNGLPTSGPDSVQALSAVDEQGNRFFVQSSYSFAAQARHTFSVGFSLSRRDDRSVRASDIKDHSASVGITSLFTIPLQTTAEFAYNRSERPSGSGEALVGFAYTTLTFSVRYGLVEDLLNVRAVVSPTYGDFGRTLVGGALEFSLMPAMTLLLEFSQYQHESGLKDSIGNLRYRYDL